MLIRMLRVMTASLSVGLADSLCLSNRLLPTEAYLQRHSYCEWQHIEIVKLAHFSPAIGE